MNKHLSPSCIRRFNLVELLIVLASAAILAALLLPFIRQIRANGRSTMCTGQLKALGAATLSYAKDSDGYFVPLSESIAPFNSWAGWAWTLKRHGYIKPFILLCPEEPESFLERDLFITSPDDGRSFVRIGYGYNIASLGAQLLSMSGFTHETPPRKLQEVKNPSHKLAFVDSIDEGVQSGIFWVRHYNDPADSRIHQRHPGYSANVAWADGHVSNVPKARNELLKFDADFGGYACFDTRK